MYKMFGVKHVLKRKIGSNLKRENKEERTMKKASLILIFTALTALAIALPQMAFAQGAGKALDFDGGNDYVDCGNDASFDITDALTVEAWVKKDTTTNQHILTKGAEFFCEIDLILQSQLLLASGFWRHERLPDEPVLPHVSFVFSGLKSPPLGPLMPEQVQHSPDYYGAHDCR